VRKEQEKGCPQASAVSATLRATSPHPEQVSTRPRRHPASSTTLTIFTTTRIVRLHAGRDRFSNSREPAATVSPGVLPSTEKSRAGPVVTKRSLTHLFDRITESDFDAPGIVSSS
jgi:hypothetical protein